MTTSIRFSASAFDTVTALCSIRYQLRAVINHIGKEMHFISTLIGRDEKLYVFDDLKGIQEVRGSTSNIETGLYTKMDEF